MSLHSTEPDLPLAQKMLGRRLRPWWGQSPGRLAMRGLVQGAVFGIVGGFALRVFANPVIEGSDGDLEMSEGRVRLIAVIVAIVCLVGLLYGLVRLVFGVIDLFSRRQVEGTVISARARHKGDWLPKTVQVGRRIQRSRGRTTSSSYRVDDRPSRYEIVLDTGDGHLTWNTDHRRFDPGLPGHRVRMTVTPMLGHVREIERLGAPATAPGIVGAPAAGPPPIPGSDPVTGSTPPSAGSASWGEERDVLGEIPGYEDHNRQNQGLPGFEQLERIPGVGRFLKGVPGLGDALSDPQKLQKWAKDQQERAERTDPPPESSEL